jgi:hypothetical protein
MLGPGNFNAEIPRQRFVGGDLESSRELVLELLDMGETLVEDDGIIDVVEEEKKPWNANFFEPTGAPLRGRLAERVCRFGHSLNLSVRGLPALPRVHRVPASQLSRTRV